ncbi:MAG: dTDP-4-dehydrorhamnose reductase [Phycisphaerales bacterium]|nr:dTDP-4-dehydrorhamnose reductase [Phycisphaerales bacterium]
MRILLLGPAGQLGTDLRAAAAAFPGVTIEPVPRSDLDVSQAGAIQPALASRSFDALVNCTSYHKTDEVEGNAQAAMTVNAFAVRELARACARASARFLHISTDYVFDGLSKRPYVESDPTGPLNVYGASKAMGEALARSVCNDLLIFRVASLFGVAGASGKGGNFVETMIRFGKEKGQLRVIGDQFMSPTGTAEVARLILLSLTKRVPPGTYHAVNSGRASWFEFASRIIERAGVSAAVESIPATAFPLPAQRPAFSVMDNTKLAALVGPIPHWHDALDRYLRAKGHRAG